VVQLWQLSTVSSTKLNANPNTAVFRCHDATTHAGDES